MGIEADAVEYARLRERMGTLILDSYEINAYVVKHAFLPGLVYNPVRVMSELYRAAYSVLGSIMANDIENGDNPARWSHLEAQIATTASQITDIVNQWNTINAYTESESLTNFEIEQVLIANGVQYYVDGYNQILVSGTVTPRNLTNACMESLAIFIDKYRKRTA